MVKKRAKKSTKRTTKRKTTKRTTKKRNPSLAKKWFILIRPENENFVIGQFDRDLYKAGLTPVPQIWLTPSYSSSFYSFRDFWQYPDHSPFIIYGELEPLSPDNKRTHKTNIPNFYGPFDYETEAFDFLNKKVKLL
jgi:hypothetical protein